MKSKNSGSGYLILTSLLCVLTFFSCKKEATDHYSKNDLNKATTKLNGTKFIGNITTVTEGDEAALVFSSANKLVIVGLAESGILHTGEIKLAELIVSKYGVVVKDVSKNEVWLLANNDEESKRKFEHVRAIFPNGKYNQLFSM